MGLRNQFMVKTSKAVATISLAPKTGESLRVVDIQCIPNVAMTEFLTLQIGRQTVGYFHIGSTIFNQLPKQYDDTTIKTLLVQLQEKGIPMYFPVAEGETLTLTAPNAWTELNIIYEVYDKGDMKSTDINGANSDEYFFIQYGTNIAAISTAVYTALTTVKNPVEFLNFPFGDSVPSNTLIEILGIGCPDVTRAGATFGTDALYSTYLRLLKERTVMFDEDRNGLPITGLTLGGGANTTTYWGLGTSLLPYGGEGTYHDLKLFPNPLVFNAGDELTTQILFAIDAGGGTLAIGEVYCAMPMHVKRS